MKNLFLLIYILAFSIFCFNVHSQEYNEHALYVRLKDNEARPKDNKSSLNEKLNETFVKHQIYTYKQAFPFAKNPRLKKVYILECYGKANELKNELIDCHSNLFDEVIGIPVRVPLYEPSDLLYISDNLWHLKKIEANKAWDITKSNPNIIIAILDDGFDVNHPDLKNQIWPYYDLMSGVQHTVYYSCREEDHGTSVASVAAGQTNGGGELAGVGFNSRIIAYTNLDPLGSALHASNVMHADVINISWSAGMCTTPPSTIYEDGIKEVLDNGTIICVAAGNGYVGANCPEPSNDGPPYNPLVPFTATYDDRIICVSGTDINDNFTHFENGINYTLSYFPEVDICAPAHNLYVAKRTSRWNVAANSCLPISYPYAIESGTSFATPIVAGVCALMKSVNSSLTPALTQTIIKSTADPIADANLYPGMLGAGRVNAYKAVLAAANACGGIYQTVTNLSGTLTQSATYTSCQINITNVTIPNGKNITCNARGNLSITGTFSAQLGSTITFKNN
jgi:subtilisin family serine protease